jgi:hypothetical protein
MTKSVRNMLYFIISDYLSTCTFITDWLHKMAAVTYKIKFHNIYARMIHQTALSGCQLQFFILIQGQKVF